MVRRHVGRVVGLAAVVLAAIGLAATPAAAAPPPSKTVAYDDLYVHAQCTANGVGPLYTVTGQVVPKLPYTTATVQCTVNGQPTISSLPTAGGLLPVTTPGPAATTVGAAVVLGDQLELCVIVDATVAAPLLPPVPVHAERCA
jgi:hypothetical protein